MQLLGGQVAYARSRCDKELF